jgi:K+-transporting ATPase ATPase A chain
MTTLELLQILVYIGLLIVCTPLLGGCMTRVFSGDRTLFSPLLRPIEGAIYRLAGVNPQVNNMRWQLLEAW